jgi:type I restriction enzyme M protein
MSLLFCKIYDELNTNPDDLPRFRVSLEEAPNRVQKRIKVLFSDVKAEYADVFSSSDTIALDKDSLTYVVGELQTYAVTEAARDAVGDAFEVFIGPAVRGEEGQFFTPRNVVQLLVDLVDPRPNERILDPACGSGGFLIVALQHIWRQVEAEGKAKSWSDVQLDRRKGEIARKSIRGLDKDAFLIKLTKAYLAIIGDGRSGVFCEDTLAPPDKWQNDDGAAAVPLGKFDVILTNPPFGSKIKVVGQHKLSQFELGHRWIKERKTDEWMRTDSLEKHQPPQVLFIERCVQFLKPGGRLGMVLPESIFGMPKYGYIVQWLMRNFTLKAFISLPEEVFQPSTHAKTCLLLLKNTQPPDDYTIHMAIADWCGHDSRGNDTLRPNSAGELVLMDDLPKISSELRTKIMWGDGE